jgi:hypothetical protein
MAGTRMMTLSVTSGNVAAMMMTGRSVCVEHHHQMEVVMTDRGTTLTETPDVRRTDAKSPLRQHPPSIPMKSTVVVFNKKPSELVEDHLFVIEKWMTLKEKRSVNGARLNETSREIVPLITTALLLPPMGLHILAMISVLEVCSTQILCKSPTHSHLPSLTVIAIAKASLSLLLRISLHLHPGVSCASQLRSSLKILIRSVRVSPRIRVN